MDERTTVRLATVPDIGIDGLRKVNAATVVIVGCGGLGHPAALYLAAAGVNRIILVDPDVVELSNLGRQILFDSGDVGQQKTTVLRHRLSAAHPHLEVVTLVGEIGDSATDLDWRAYYWKKHPSSTARITLVQGTRCRRSAARVSIGMSGAMCFVGRVRVRCLTRRQALHTKTFLKIPPGRCA